MRNVVWTAHAKERFFERSLKHGVTYDEVEQKIKEQKIKQWQPNDTIKTIFGTLDNFFTVIKEETKTQINTISIWEANDAEVEIWNKKQ